MKTQTQQTEKPVLSKEEVRATLASIADEIKLISDAMQVFSNSKLRRSVIVTLIQNQSKLPRKTIDIVLNNLQDLSKDYLKP